MSWNRKAVTGKFDRLYYVETEKTATDGLPALCFGTEKP